MPPGRLRWLASSKWERFRVMDRRYANAFCKSRGAVSLFDFGPSAIDDWGQFDNWQGWFGHQQNSRVAVWLGIDRQVVAPHLFDAGTTHALSRENPSAKIIPGVEACHNGSLPLHAIEKIVFIDQHNREALKIIAKCDNAVKLARDFEESLPPPPMDHPIIAALKAAEQRRK